MTDLERTRRVIEDIVRTSPVARIPGSLAARPGAEERPGPPFPASVSVMVRAYALTESPPKRLRFSEHLLRFSDAALEKPSPDLIWGVYGTESMARASAYAAMEAQRSGRRLYQIDLWYKVARRVSHSYNPPMTAEEIRRTGFMQLGRVDADYREYLRMTFLERLRELGDPMLGKLRMEPSPDVLAAQRPMLVHWLMRLCPWLRAVQHTVHVGDGIALKVITLRRDPGRYLHVSTRHHPEIVTSV